jgi:hypothetical protein
MDNLECVHCGQQFAWRTDMMRHTRTVHGNFRYNCPICNIVFSRKDSFQRHAKKHNSHTPVIPVLMYQKDQVGETCTKDDDTNKEILASDDMFELSKKECALKRNVKTYCVTATGEGVTEDPAVFLAESIPLLEQQIINDVGELKGIVFWSALAVELEKMDGTETAAHFSHPRTYITNNETIKEILVDCHKSILNNFDTYQERGSGWVVKKVSHLDLHVSVYNPLRASSYTPLPPALKNKNAILNIKNKDNKCFMWCILAHLHHLDYKNNPNYTNYYKEFENELNFTGIDFPVTINDIPVFEKLNDMCVNVYQYDNGVLPLQLSDSMSSTVVNLMLYNDHYSLIRNFNALLYDQRKHMGAMYWCPRCNIPKYSQSDLDEHLISCKRNQRVTMPSDTILKFKNIEKELKAPLTIYADFECLLLKIEGPEPNISSTTKKNLHVPCGYGLVSVKDCNCREPVASGLTVYRGKDAVNKFLDNILEIANAHQKEISKPMTKFTMVKGDSCHICSKVINIGEKAHRDHCHVCGKFRGNTHAECNMKYKISRDIVVAFHNLRKYDGHFIMQEIGTVANRRGLQISCIAKGMEDYLTFSIKMKNNRKRRINEQKVPFWRIKFIDTCQFLTASLDSLVKNLTNFPITRSCLPENGIDLLLRKGVYPYEFMDSWEKFEINSLPSREKFYSNLTDSNISREDYTHATTVWNKFDLKNIGQYHDLYLKTDVLLLADVFEAFRSFALKNYKLDPCHFYTLPSFTWNSFLRMTGVELELLQDLEMYTFIETVFEAVFP